MKAPATIQYAYIDFDGFFAGVEETINPAIRGRPIGVTPHDPAQASCIIAANYTAKRRGVKSIMPLRDVRAICPDIVLVAQKPDRYVKAHHRLLDVIRQHAPITHVYSIDELFIRLDHAAIADPIGFATAIKADIRKLCGPWLTCSIGFGPSSQLAKIASDMDKPDGITLLPPETLPGRLLDLKLDDIPGIASRMKLRLYEAGIYSVQDLWHTAPKHLRAIWGSVDGERFWYGLHGYDIPLNPTVRCMYGHGRVLPPDWQGMDRAYDCAHLLTVKAAVRLRRDGWLAHRFSLYLTLPERASWSGEVELTGGRSDTRAAIKALQNLWDRARSDLPKPMQQQRLIRRLHITFYHLTPAGTRQYDLFDRTSGTERARSEKLAAAIDRLNARAGRSLVTQGIITQPPGGYAGGKIAFTHIPTSSDFE